MSDLISDLDDIFRKAESYANRYDTTEVRTAISTLIDVANSVGDSHCGSWLGYHSCVYYDGLERPPRGAFFDRQWGLHGRFSSETVGDWEHYQYAEIYDHLSATVTTPSYDELNNLMAEAAPALDDLRDDLVSVIEACRSIAPDAHLDRLKADADGCRMTPREKYAQADMPKGPFMSNDHTAAAGGIQPPPHVVFRSNIKSLRSLFSSSSEIARIAERTKRYLMRKTMASSMLIQKSVANNIFLGHGHSNAWLELKTYLEDRHGIKCDHFNRPSTAGKTNVERLTQMLDDACFAFIVLTAEDEKTDGTIVARMNVIHEVGLFQGRLGFARAIILLEKGCDTFSNIHGLTYIPFEKGKIKEAFHEVADTLKREGII